MFLKIPIIRERLVILPLLFHSQEKKNKTHKKKKKPKRTNTIKKKNNKTIYDYVYINMISQISRLIIKKKKMKKKNKKYSHIGKTIGETTKQRLRNFS